MSTTDTSISQSVLIPLALVCNSPEEYFLKKSAGREIRRNIVEASIEIDNFVLILAEIIDLTELSNKVVIEKHIVKIAIPKSNLNDPLPTTVEKRILLIFGVNIPSKLSISVIRTIAK